MKYIFIFFSLLVSLVSAGQDPAYPISPVAAGNIIKAEYFFDTDPGFGNGTDLPVSAAVNLPGVAAVVNTGSLSNGVHRFHFRTLSTEGKWSLTNTIDFIVNFDPPYPTVPASPGNVVKAEYFFDTDPGFGNGINIPVPAASDLPGVLASINITGLSAGTHRLNIRTLSIEGKWSLTNVREFIVDLNPPYPSVPPASGNIVKAEYYFDTDPGFGNGIDIPVASAADLPGVSAAINTSALSVGTHRFYMRTLSAEGKWSLSNVREFLVDINPAYPLAPPVPGNIVKAEYFFDTDPGFGNGVDIPITAAIDISGLSITVNTVGLTNGAHRVYLRTLSLEGKWSHTNMRDFVYNSDPAYPSAPAAPGNITIGEYFFDSDPGFGNGFPIIVSPAIDLSNINFSANTSALADGNHILYIRSKDNADWAITNYISFLKGAPVPLQLLSFAGRKAGNNIRLNWVTENEINASHFEIERSNNAVSFIKSGLVPAFNTTARNHYDFTDLQPYPGINYYRLKEYDRDGSFVYSPVIKVMNEKSELVIAISPNPVKDKIHIKYTGINEMVSIIIHDAQGKIVKQIAQQNTLSIIVDVSSLPGGGYFIQLSDGSMVQKGMFIKQ